MINKLKKYMKENKLNQQQLASLLNISESHLSKLMNGHAKPGAVVIKKYSALPGIQEQETINHLRKVINNMWLSGEIKDKQVRKLLEILKNLGD